MKYEELKDALDGLIAYDEGATDSGIHDEGLRQRCQEYIRSLPPKEQRALVAKLTIDMYLSPTALDAGYGPEDAKGFLEWMDDEMNCLVC